MESQNEARWGQCVNQKQLFMCGQNKPGRKSSFWSVGATLAIGWAKLENDGSVTEKWRVNLAFLHSKNGSMHSADAALQCQNGFHIGSKQHWPQKG
jgi:hypothetical protein